MSRLGALAASVTPSPSPTTTFTDGSLPAPGWTGFLILLAMGGALVVLLLSLNKQLRKVPPDPVVEPEQAPEPEAGTDTAAEAEADAGPGGDRG